MMVRQKAKAFTLVEVLVAVAIIILLVSILTPALGRVLEHSRRSACAANVKEIVRAVKAYALSPPLHRGRTPKSFPDTNFDPEDWPTGNRACLWLLVRRGFISPETFICPSLDDFTAAKSTAAGFDDDNCGYSFISMVEPPRTLNNTSSSLVIVADLNPRLNPGSSVIYEYADFDHSGGIDSAEQKLADELSNDHRLKNSATHGHDGQNVARLDGGAAFIQRAFVAIGADTQDWIYESEDSDGDQDPAKEKQGKCGHDDDVFLVN